jgi:hypothetical protein
MCQHYGAPGEVYDVGLISNILNSKPGGGGALCKNVSTDKYGEKCEVFLYSFTLKWKAGDLSKRREQLTQMKSV